MSTIKVDNIRIASESVSRPATGVAAAWVNFNGTTVTAPNDMTGVRDSLNMTGVVDNGVGDYAILFTNSFANPNYAAVGSAHDAGTSWSANPNMGFSGTSRVQGSCPFLNANVINGGQVTDTSIADATYHGDLA